MKKVFIHTIASLVLLAIVSFPICTTIAGNANGTPAKKGELAYTWAVAGEEPDGFLDGWQKPNDLKAGKIVADRQGVSFELPAPASSGDSNSDLMIRRELSLEKLKGTVAYISAEVQTEDIPSSKPQPWNGAIIRMQVISESGTTNSGGGMANAGDTNYSQAKIEENNSTWTKVGFLTSIPANSKSAALHIGLEKVPGKMRIRNLSIKIVRTDEQEPIAKTPGPPYYKGHSLPALRGVEVTYSISEEDVRVLSQEWNVNAIRWQLGESTFAEGLETRHYDQILERELLQFDRALRLFRKYDIGVILNLQSLSKKLFNSKVNQERLVNVWRMLAAKYKNEPVVIAYDFANEPIQTEWQEGALLWNELAQYVAEEIRKVDPAKPIIVEAEIMSLPDGFRTLKPVSVSNVVYSVHVYSPGYLTHNQVWDKNQKPVKYPGMIENDYWDKKRIEQDLAPVRKFQETYGGHILVGEFGAVRWSPGSDEYIKDMIELFEEYGWDWIYHSYREWHGWSAEHDDNIKNTKPAAFQTEREKLLRSWFAKNQRFDFPKE
ncbi:glycoside hydrolase family 5 protein [Geminisphaera colitermitum]|uniref:glycoside hydrolase family 5 protein n=1 Tax=Geminisphaera colitermitum TaxID=1148786 RepID=UPI0001965477|nr:cellulase family glycosylhydrolase [Geminisphaera colitermitum]